MNSLLAKKTLEFPLLPKVEEKHSITSQHTDKSGKSRLDNCCHIIACPNFHDEEGRQQHPNNTDNLFRNLTQGIRLHVVKALEKAP